MRLTYVIPDIHGRYDLLSDALAGIAARGEIGTIVTLGDYVDKGPDSKQVIDRLLPGVAAGWRFVALKGNHDVLMVEALRDPAKMAAWLAKGGDTALASYGGDPAAVPPAHIAWLDQLSLTHVDAYRLYVHAGVDPDVPLELQRETTLLCKRYPKGFPDGPLLYEGRTNLDTLAWRTGRLMVGVFDDDRPGGPVDFIEVRGPPAVG